jgi:ubiquinone/menaquinone biosynthesis C-methylase UbiE
MGLRSRLFALTYDRMMAGTDRAGFAATRASLLGPLAGDVLEIGAGTGRNLPHYGAGARSLVLTEPDVSMFARAERAARHDDRHAPVVRAPAEDLPFDDATFDTVVSTLVLCGVDDQPRAAREIRRVLKPGGRLVFAEHVRAGDERTAHLQDRWNWLNRLVAGCDCNRPTLRTLEHSGFALGDVRHGELPKAPAFVRPMVVGTATRPPDGGAHDPTTTTTTTVTPSRDVREEQ